MKFICLVYEEERVFHEMTPDQWRSLRQETLDYVDSLREQGRLIDARPLRSATTASTIRVRDGLLSVTDGPFAETKEQIGGFFVVEAGDMDEAVQIAAGWPSAPLGTIEVRPLDETLSVETRY